MLGILRVGGFRTRHYAKNRSALRCRSSHREAHGPEGVLAITSWEWLTTFRINRLSPRRSSLSTWRWRWNRCSSKIRGVASSRTGIPENVVPTVKPQQQDLLREKDALAPISVLRRAVYRAFLEGTFRRIKNERAPGRELPTAASSMDLRGFTNSCGEPLF